MARAVATFTAIARNQVREVAENFLLLVSPVRRRVVTKYPPARQVPFLPSASLAHPGDVIIAIEQCFHCDRHFTVWHDQKRYTSTADRCLIAIVRGLLEKGLPVRVFALKDIPSSTRLGALEVTLSLRTRAPVGSKKEWISTTVFSKLDSKCWPVRRLWLPRVATLSSGLSLKVI